ncbi:hypothetical protein [Sulfitobacter sp. EhC04]|nr:hypothetical protein [Sulfitobacter sp. EhC04]
MKTIALDFIMLHGGNVFAIVGFAMILFGAVGTYREAKRLKDDQGEG